MVRVPLSKDERKRLKAQRRAGLSGKALLDDFQDDIADIVAGAGRQSTWPTAQAAAGTEACSCPMLRLLASE